MNIDKKGVRKTLKFLKLGKSDEYQTYVSAPSHIPYVDAVIIELLPRSMVSLSREALKT